MILGGSHSAFSVLYMMLYGPVRVNLFDDFKRRGSSKQKVKQSGAPKGFQQHQCTKCLACPFYMNHVNESPCVCDNLCTCLSRPVINLDNYEKDIVTQTILSPEDSVTIVYRNCIKVHFSTAQEAAKVMYSDYDKNLDLSKGGIVYPFTGIRGDAKELWFKVT